MKILLTGLNRKTAPVAPGLPVSDEEFSKFAGIILSRRSYQRCGLLCRRLLLV